MKLVKYLILLLLLLIIITSCTPSGEIDLTKVSKDDIDKTYKASKKGYSGRADFVLEAIREKIDKEQKIK